MISIDPPQALLDDRADPDARSVLEDWTLTHGWRTTRFGIAIASDDADDAPDAYAARLADDIDDAADDAIDDATDAYDGAYDDGAYDDAAGAYDDVDNVGDANGYDDDDAALRNRLNQNLYGDLYMTDGLKIIRVPGGRYGYPVTLVGWMRRVAGDEWEIVGARVMIRTGAPRASGLARAASHGPEQHYTLSESADGPEELHRLLIKRVWPCIREAWERECPRPGWA
jgi:hypothetical protein